MVDANPAMVFAFRPERAAYSGPRHRLGNVVDSKSEPYRGGIENYEFRITNYVNSCVIYDFAIMLNMLPSIQSLSLSNEVEVFRSRPKRDCLFTIKELFCIYSSPI